MLLSNITACFEKLMTQRQHEAQYNTHSFRIRALKYIIHDLHQLKEQHLEVHSIDLFKDRKGYGKKTIRRIQEILKTGTLQELDDTAIQTPEQIQIQKWTTVSGIGQMKAKKLVAKGYHVEATRQLYHQKKENIQPLKLTHAQTLGIKHYDDLQHKIPREHISEFEKMLHIAYKQKHIPCKIVICGSYRRGKEFSGDIDVLLSRYDWDKPSIAQHTLYTVTQYLLNNGYLIDHMINPKTCKTKYMGYIKLPWYERVCRIDIRAVLFIQFIPALLYFTGSKEENVRIRKLAKQKNYKLNEYELIDGCNKSIHLSSEKELYELLNEPYKPPEDR